MVESFKEKDEKFVRETVDKLVKRSNLIAGENDPGNGVGVKIGEILSGDNRVTVTLSKDDIKRKTDRTVVRSDALKNIATQFQQYGCTTVVSKDKIKVTGPVEQSREMTLDELDQSVKEGLAREAE